MTSVVVAVAPRALLGTPSGAVPGWAHQHAEGPRALRGQHSSVEALEDALVVGGYGDGDVPAGVTHNVPEKWQSDPGIASGERIINLW